CLGLLLPVPAAVSGHRAPTDRQLQAALPPLACQGGWWWLRVATARLADLPEPHTGRCPGVRGLAVVSHLSDGRVPELDPVRIRRRARRGPAPVGDGAEGPGDH